MQSLVRRQAIFTLGVLICGCLEVAVGLGLVGLSSAEGIAYSVLICLIPGWLTIYVSDLVKQHDLAAYTVLVGTAVRMLFVLLGLFAVSTIRPDLGFREFTVWLIVGYSVSLALETWMVVLPSSTDAAK